MFITNASHAALVRRLRLDRPEPGPSGPFCLSSSLPTPRASSSSSTWTRWDSARPTRRRSPSRRSRLADNRLGEGRAGLQDRDDHPRRDEAPGTAIAAVGVARAAFEYACEYSKTRTQFGQPIAMNQGVNFIADMATKIEASRLLCLAGSLDGRQRLRPEGDPVLVDGQAVCRRHVHGGDDRRRPDLRRLRVHSRNTRSRS